MRRGTSGKRTACSSRAGPTSAGPASVIRPCWVRGSNHDAADIADLNPGGGESQPGSGRDPRGGRSTGRANRGSRLWSAGQFVVALVGTAAYLVYLLVGPTEPPTEPVERVSPPREVVTTIGRDRIRVEPGSPFDQNIRLVPVRSVTLSEPTMTVVGRVVASLRPGDSPGEDFWQFDTAERLAAYSDWQKALADLEFAETQLRQIRRLAEVQIQAQQEVVRRLERLVEAGTDTVRDLVAEKANLIQVEINGRREIHQAETALRMARREEAVQARRLQQEGLTVELLQSATSDVDIVMADVPEGRVNLVTVGQGCVARFYGLAEEVFAGRVRSIAPVLSAERRSLRVLFTVDDPADELRPGMFAEIGLGTDERSALLIPSEAVLHIGRSDYVLVAETDDVLRIVEVQVGEPHGTELEILSGLSDGLRVVGPGAILLKPLAVRSLQQPRGSR